MLVLRSGALLRAAFVVVGLTASGAVVAQGAPTPAQAVTFANERLGKNPSAWLPCRDTTKLELSADGELTVRTSRQSFCEDSEVRVHLTALDPSSVVVELADTAVIRADCVESGCVRVSEKRKQLGAAGWEARRADFEPSPPRSGPYLRDALIIELANTPRSAQEVGDALRFMIQSSASVPEFQDPGNPFRVASN